MNIKNCLVCILIITTISFSRAWGKTYLNRNIHNRLLFASVDTPMFNTDVYINATYIHMVSPKQLQFHINEKVYTQGKVFNAQIDPKNHALLLSIGVDSLHQRVTIIIKNKYRAKFDHPEVDLIGKTITVLGWVSFYKREPAMKLSAPKDLQIYTGVNN